MITRLRAGAVANVAGLALIDDQALRYRANNLLLGETDFKRGAADGLAPRGFRLLKTQHDKQGVKVVA